MPDNPGILFISNGSLNASKIGNLLDGTSLIADFCTYNNLASKLAATSTYQVLVFHAADLHSPQQLHHCQTLARKLKTNPGTSHMRLLCIGIRRELMSERQPHHFDDLMVGEVRLPALRARLSDQLRLITIETEINRRNHLAELYNCPSHISLPMSGCLEEANILITGKPNGYANLEKTLSPFATLVGALSLNAANEYLNHHPFDMILINGGKTPARFYDFIENVRNKPALFNLPILMVSSPSKITDSHIAYEAGLTDTLEAPVNPNELLIRTACLIREYRFRKAISKTYKNARHLTTSDALTGLYAYGFFEQHLRETIKDHQNRGSSFTLITIAIENIRHINSEHGPIEGDKVLRQVADSLMHIVRAEDLASRISGARFALTLPNTNEKDGNIVLSRIEALLKQTDFLCTEKSEAINIEFEARLIVAEQHSTIDDILRARAETPPEANTTIAT